MTELSFHCTGVRAAPHAAGPTLLFGLRLQAPPEVRVHAVALRCQLRIEPAARRYDDAEAAALSDLFGDRERWGSTLRPLQFAQVSVVAPGFTGSTELELPVPCSYDLDIAASRYCSALHSGEAPLTLLFSGTVFSGPGGFQVTPVPWDKEARCRLPASVWQEMLEQHFPGCGWLRLPRAELDALRAYRSRHALPSWEATVRALLSAADAPEPSACGTGTEAAPSTTETRLHPPDAASAVPEPTGRATP